MRSLTAAALPFGKVIARSYTKEHEEKHSWVLPLIPEIGPQKLDQKLVEQFTKPVEGQYDETGKGGLALKPACSDND